MEQHHVQLALERRDVRKELRQADSVAQRQHVESALLRVSGRINPDGAFLSRAH